MKKKTKSKNMFTYKQLAYLFCTTVGTIENYISTGKFKMDNPPSIFRFFAREYDNVRDREEEFSMFEHKDRNYTISVQDKLKMSALTKEWGLDKTDAADMW